MKYSTLSFTLVLFLASLCTASASSFSYIAVFGDSLSDNGNLYAAVGYPPAPYYNGRMSNGPVAVEYLSSQLGSPLLDYAWIGATTGVGNVVDSGTATSFGASGLPGMSTVFNTVLPGLPVSSSALYVVWGGPNDVLGDLATPALLTAAIFNAVSNLDSMVNALQAAGARHILVPDMPDLGLTPRLLALGPAAAAEGTAVTNLFNQALLASLPPGVTFFDTAALLRTITADPALYGFTDVTDPCYNGTTVCADPNQYLFWDSIHPTTAADAILGAQFSEAVVPEPATFVLAFGGMIFLGLLARRRQRS
jgi:phospholipase/lecithinase/hemolysin